MNSIVSMRVETLRVGKYKGPNKKGPHQAKQLNETFLSVQTSLTIEKNLWCEGN